MLWLGMIIKERGASFNNDVGLPGANNLKIGLEHLQEYLDNNGGIYCPKITLDPKGGIDGDYGNILMLTYYRNPLNSIFYHESLVLSAMHSFGIENEWQVGIDIDQLYERSCFISELLKLEEVVEQRITKQNRKFFDEII